MVQSSDRRSGVGIYQRRKEEKKWRRIVRFRIGNEIRKGKY